MNKNFTHKILPILSIFLLVVFTLCTSSFAQDIELPSNTQDLINSYINNTTYNSTYPINYVIAKDFNGDTYILFGSFIDGAIGNGTVSNSIKGKYYLYISTFVPSGGNGTDGYYYFYYKLVDGNWQEVSYLNSTISSDYASYRRLILDYSDTDIYSNADLYQYTNNIYYSSVDISNLGYLAFPFPVAPQEALLPIVEQQETIMKEKTLGEILGILPIVMIIIVSLIGLRKALRLLLTLLRSS